MIEWHSRGNGFDYLVSTRTRGCYTNQPQQTNEDWQVANPRLKYDSKAYDKILIRVEAGKKDEIKAHAEKYQKESGTIGTSGYSPKGSLTGFINRAIDETMEKDKSSKSGE